MGTCWNKQNWFWGSKPKPAGILETKEGAWAGACSGTGRRQAPGWLSRACSGAHSWGVWSDLVHHLPSWSKGRHYSWLDDPPGQSKPTAHTACSISLAARLTALESVPGEAQSCPQHRTAQPHPGCEMTSEHDSAYCTQPAFISLWPFYRLSAALTGIWHIHFGLLHKVTLSRWTHCSWDVGNVLLSLLWAHTRTCDRTFCQPWVRIFNHFTMFVCKIEILQELK